MRLCTVKNSCVRRSLCLSTISSHCASQVPLLGCYCTLAHTPKCLGSCTQSVNCVHATPPPPPPPRLQHTQAHPSHTSTVRDDTAARQHAAAGGAAALPPATLCAVWLAPCRQRLQPPRLDAHRQQQRAAAAVRWCNPAQRARLVVGEGSAPASQRNAVHQAKHVRLVALPCGVCFSQSSDQNDPNSGRARVVQALAEVIQTGTWSPTAGEFTSTGLGGMHRSHRSRHAEHKSVSI